MIFFGTASLERAIRSYVAHYLTERNHQGLDNELIDGWPSGTDGEVIVNERLGGLLKYYHRVAA